MNTTAQIEELRRRLEQTQAEKSRYLARVGTHPDSKELATYDKWIEKINGMIAEKESETK